jgi:hypothetical protein
MRPAGGEKGRMSGRLFRENIAEFPNSFAIGFKSAGLSDII